MFVCMRVRVHVCVRVCAWGCVGGVGGVRVCGGCVGALGRALGHGVHASALVCVRVRVYACTCVWMHSGLTTESSIFNRKVGSSSSGQNKKKATT